MTNNDNNRDTVSDEKLKLVLIYTDNLAREGVIRFNAGKSETAGIGKVESLREVFGKALTLALETLEVPFDKENFEARIEEAGLRKKFGSISRDAIASQLREILTVTDKPRILAFAD